MAHEWQAAHTEFERGLELCKWYGDLDQLPNRVRLLSDQLRVDRLCARGMILMAERQWQPAIRAFEQLVGLDSSYKGIGIAAQLERARFEETIESLNWRIHELQENGKWEEALQVIEQLETHIAIHPEARDE